MEDKIYVCDDCENEMTEVFGFNNDDGIYCKKCYDYRCGLGDLAAEAAIEREREE